MKEIFSTQVNLIISCFQVCPDFTGLALGLENCFTAFVALAFGMVVGFCLFILECCSRLCKLNLFFLEAYDRGDDDLEEVNPEDFPRILQIKDTVIKEKEEQAIFFIIQQPCIKTGRGGQAF